MEAKKNVRHSDMMERICEQLAQLPEEDTGRRSCICWAS